jgi:hypothetical protein
VYEWHPFLHHSQRSRGVYAVIAVFYQETGEEGIVHLSATYTLVKAIEDHPEWSFRYIEEPCGYTDYWYAD